MLIDDHLQRAARNSCRTTPEHRRALRQAAITRRRADRLGAVADRLLALVEEALCSGERGLTPTKCGVRGRGRRTLVAGRARALGILAGIDAANHATPPAKKGWPTNLVPQTLYCAMQAMRLAQELGEKAYSLDIERAAALANATARASKAGELDARAAAAAKAQERAWDVPRAPHDGSPPPGPARLFNSVDRDPDIPDPRDDPLRAYLTVEPEVPDDLPEAPDPALPQPIAPGGRAERGGRHDSGAKWPPPSRWNDASAAKDGVGLEANFFD